MDTNNITKINDQLTYLYSNGKGEAGLEISADSGLGKNEYIRIPKSMKKNWAAKIDVDLWNLDRTNKQLIQVKEFKVDSNVKDFVGKAGWVTSGLIRFYEGKKQCQYKEGDSLKWIDILEFHIDPHNIDDQELLHS